MSQDSEKQERLQREITSAFRYAIDTIVKIIHDYDDLTTLEFQIAYNKKLDHVEILKVVLVNDKKIVLEPPVWISDHKYHPLEYACKDTNDRVIILGIPARMPDMIQQLQKITGLPKI